jgi:hypothetical protein
MNMSKHLFFYFTFLLFAEVTMAQVTVTGTVKDAKGTPVAGATVSPKNAAKGIVTDTLGFFSIKTNPGGALTISAVGFEDTTLAINYQRNMNIILRQKSQTLNQVVVSPNQSQPLTLTNEILNEQNIQNTLDDYVKSEILGEGVKNFSTGENGGTKGGHIITTANLGTTNYGGMIPVYHQPVDTKGSRYLMSDWSSGLVVNQYDTIISNPSYLFNYDKITGDLMMTQDKQNYISIDRSEVKSFAIKNSNGGYVFARVPETGSNGYFQVISKGEKYAIYKSIKTKLVKAQGQSNGLTTVGNDYDEYVDEYIYYLVDIKNKSVKQFELKKKSIKEAVEAEKDKAEKYFADHKRDDLDDNFLRGFGAYLNA